MQLRIFITICLFAIHHLTFGQQGTPKNLPSAFNAKAFNTLQEKVFASYLALDSTTASTINDKGIIFFKFNIEKGQLKNIKHTESAATFFGESITKYLMSIPDFLLPSSSVDKNETFILPIKYDYRTANRIKTMNELLKKLPNTKGSTSKFGFEDFNSLFELDGKNIYGVKCTLLTPLEISRPID